MSFAHLHVHSEYSLLDGLAKIPVLVSKAKQEGSPALALTDHGVMYGAIPFYQECVKQGVKPILGCEVYVTAGARSDRTKEERYHLVLLARNKAGYRNLLQLVSKAHLEGFYYRPRVDHALLEEHADGLIALSGCIQGEIPRLLQKGHDSAAATLAQWYNGIFKDGFFLELQRHPKGMPELESVTQGLLTLANKHNIPIVATNDSHYTWQDDYEAHDVLLCIGTGAQLADEKRKRYPDDSFYLKGQEEMEYLFPEFPEALANTLVIADLVDLHLTFDRLELPEFSVPGAHTPDTYLAELCWKALPSLYITGYESAKERLRSELDVIRQTGFATYMLIVADFVRYARDRGIVYGPRGSAAGSIVTYCLGISDLDPIRHKLVFERFLNIERKEMPDIDMDFADSQRGAMIEYAAERYGRDHVAQIVTFGTFGPKAALRDVGRVMGWEHSDISALTKLVPEGPKVMLQQVLDTVPDFRARYEQDVRVEELVEMAMRLEGVARHASTHAAGVVISRDPLVEHVPLQRSTGDSGGIAVSQYDMNVVAKVGLLKMDFLGIANLMILDQAVRMVNETAWDAIDLSKLSLDDSMVFRLISAGHTANVFQLEGAGMTRYIKELQPTTFDDLAAMIALFRPGPIEHIPTYIARKHDKEPVVYPHPLLADILADTFGIMIYQDQVLQVLRKIAGYSLGQADIVRKAMGKKKPELMVQERTRFREGAAKTIGLPAAEADALFDTIEPFAGYGFNKCSAGYEAIYRPCTNKKHPRLSLAEMYRIHHDRDYARDTGHLDLHKKYRGQGYGTALSMNEQGRLVKNKIVDIRFVGTRTVFRLRLRQGATMDCTANHKFPTSRGELRLDQLQVGDRLYVNGGYERQQHDPTYNLYDQPVSLAHPGKEGFQPNPNGRWVILADFKRYCRESRFSCEGCDAPYARGFEAHHVAGDRKINGDGHYRWLCNACHKKWHYERLDRRRQFEKGLLTTLDEIIAIEPLADAEVYDVEMAAPYHNFVTDQGIVTSNSHASCYALVAYRTAWMKAHYPLQYMCAVLTAARGSTEKLIAAAAECRRFGIRLLGPDIDHSGIDFTIEGEAIRYGLDAIKGVGELARTIFRARWSDGGASPPFAGLVDFTRRVSSAARSGSPTMNKVALEALIKAGALDDFGNRPTLLSSYPSVAKSVGLAKLAVERGQGSLLDMLDAPIAAEGPSLIVLPDVSAAEKVAWEREFLSFPITPHPGLESLAKLGGQGMNTLAEVVPEHTGRRLRLPVLVVHVREVYTKTGQPMAFVKVEDIAGAAEVTVFPRVYEQTRPLWETGKLLIIEGKVASRVEGANLLVDRARTAEVEKVLQTRRPSKPPGPRTPANWS